MFYAPPRGTLFDKKKYYIIHYTLFTVLEESSKLGAQQYKARAPYRDDSQDICFSNRSNMLSIMIIRHIY
jgi:hypothetical protein